MEVQTARGALNLKVIHTYTVHIRIHSHAHIRIHSHAHTHTYSALIARVSMRSLMAAWPCNVQPARVIFAGHTHQHTHTRTNNTYTHVHTRTHTRIHTHLTHTTQHNANRWCHKGSSLSAGAMNTCMRNCDLNLSYSGSYYATSNEIERGQQVFRRNHLRRFLGTFKRDIEL